MKCFLLKGMRQLNSADKNHGTIVRNFLYLECAYVNRFEI